MLIGHSCLTKPAVEQIRANPEFPRYLGTSDAGLSDLIKGALLALRAELPYASGKSRYRCGLKVRKIVSTRLSEWTPMKGAGGVLVAGLVSSTDAEGRRVYSALGKRALVERALAPGVSVSRLALDHGVNANLLRKWIRRYQGTSVRLARQTGSPQLPQLLPVVTVGPTALPAPVAQPSPVPSPSIEIVVAGISVHVCGAVDAQSLGAGYTVLDCLLARR